MFHFGLVSTSSYELSYRRFLKGCRRLVGQLLWFGAGSSLVGTIPFSSTKPMIYLPLSLLHNAGWLGHGRRV